MSRRVVISGLGPVSGLGIGIDPTWTGACAGQSAIRRIDAFDPAGFDCQIGAQTPGFKISQFVPKTYRKATKVMSRDIELAVVTADQAARDARLNTPGTAAASQGSDRLEPTYDPTRVGCHIGAGLIAADLDELTGALVEARVAEGEGAGDFDIHAWGRDGMQHLTPLWLLKYLPNMLACHVTIIHNTQGPSNTITCAEASGGLSIGESLRVIQRGSADLCFCGGAESKLNPMAFLRQQFTGRLNTTVNDDPTRAVRPFDRQAAGTAIGEGGGIVILEALETFERRTTLGSDGPEAYAEVIGFGASQTVNRQCRNLEPDPGGRSIAAAIRAALGDARIEPEAIDLIVPFGSGVPSWDQAEASAMRGVFGPRLSQIAITSVKALVGNCGAGAGGLDLCIAAKALAEQTVPAIINRDQPIDGFCRSNGSATPRVLQYALVFSTGSGGQNTAMVLKRSDR